MSDINGLDDTIKLLEQELQSIEKLHNMPTTVVSNSDRIAPAGDKIRERGSLKDRLGQTDKEALNIHRIEKARNHQEMDENLTDKEHEDAVDEMALKMIDDILGANFGSND